MSPQGLAVAILALILRVARVPSGRHVLFAWQASRRAPPPPPPLTRLCDRQYDRRQPAPRRLSGWPARSSSSSTQLRFAASAPPAYRRAVIATEILFSWASRTLVFVRACPFKHSLSLVDTAIFLVLLRPVTPGASPSRNCTSRCSSARARCSERWRKTAAPQSWVGLIVRRLGGDEPDVSGGEVRGGAGFPPVTAAWAYDEVLASCSGWHRSPSEAPSSSWRCCGRRAATARRGLGSTRVVRRSISGRCWSARCP
jgi:hypothetical protein